MKGKLIALVAAGVLTVPLDGAAQTVTLVCSSGPNQAPELSFDIDYTRSVVNYPMPGLAARISDRHIEWTSPARSEPGGGRRYAGSFMLDRTTGRFMRGFDCNECPAAPPLFCSQAKKLF